MSQLQKTRRQFIRTTGTAAAALTLAGRLAPGVFASITAQDDDGWVSLFDGRTLNGWHRNPERIGHGTGGHWAVEDGVIAGEQDPPGSGNGGILLTDQKFGDFELLIDMKPDWGVCSGLFLRANDKGQCLQVMVDYHDNGNVGHLYGEGVGGFNTRCFDINGKYDGDKLVGLQTAKEVSASDVGAVSSCLPAEWLKAWNVTDWNTAKVRCVGADPKITTWINGVKVCEFDGATSTNEGYNKAKEQIRRDLGTEGSIAVQVHGGTGWPKGAKCRWKNIKIRKIDANA
ncbi:MAG: DUF1080 domain-containing protein [Planctomycetaceae bacterium]